MQQKTSAVPQLRFEKADSAPAGCGRRPVSTLQLLYLKQGAPLRSAPGRAFRGAAIAPFPRSLRPHGNATRPYNPLRKAA